MVFALLPLTLAGIALLLVGLLGLRGKLPPNHFAGIRTPYTMRSSENWYATHRHAAPVLIFAGAAVAAAGLALLPFAAAGALPASFVVVVSFVMTLIILAGAIWSWLSGTRRARRDVRPG